MKKTREQERIDRKVSARKNWLLGNFPICIYCLHRPDKAELSHLIRRSYASDEYKRDMLQTFELNMWLACHECHDIFDNNPRQAIHFNNFWGVMQLIRFIDPAYSDQLMTNIYEPILKETELWQPNWKKETLTTLYTMPGLIETVNSGC